VNTKIAKKIRRETRKEMFRYLKAIRLMPLRERIWFAMRVILGR
jgi:hypothetical protein